MHFSLRHILASLFAVVFTSSVVDAMPTQIQGDGPSVVERAADSQAMTRIRYQNYAASAINALQKTYYNPNAGLWGKIDGKGVGQRSYWSQYCRNELYLTASAKLANRLPDKKTSSGQGYYFEQALAAYAYLVTDSTTTMNPSTHLFNDGISMKTCKNNGGVVFTYNQGIIIAGLTELTWSTANHAYTALAVQISHSVISNLTTSSGILQDKVCEPNACNVDEQQFKGVFTRNLAFLINRATGSMPRL
ncbi:hypothetical protein DID88_001031 [Monilinia fructigena]|uniref:Mannan endo-1,6-alpha-mannosidase n=1 Tax=Monilinia fructigena TaxID=38457 RepID=A0A395IYY3_9HELO|nr:hypothetical protein DID88_001031 [Monilinia fructigena]